MLVDINDEWGESSAAALRDRGFDVMYIKTDVRYSEQVDAMVAQAVERYGRLDILVHGAGVGVHHEIVDMSDAEWDLQIDVQLRGAFLLSRAVGRQLIKQGEGGRIILIGSTSGNNARPMSGPHAASKAGEIQLSRVMALEMGKHNITCNVVAPGLTNIAGISLSSQNPEYQKAFVTQVPLGQAGRPGRDRRRGPVHRLGPGALHQRPVAVRGRRLLGWQAGGERPAHRGPLRHDRRVGTPVPPLQELASSSSTSWTWFDPMQGLSPRSRRLLAAAHCGDRRRASYQALTRLREARSTTDLGGLPRSLKWN